MAAFLQWKGAAISEVGTNQLIAHAKALARTCPEVDSVIIEILQVGPLRSHAIIHMKRPEDGGWWRRCDAPNWPTGGFDEATFRASCGYDDAALRVLAAHSMRRA